jgi:hypothetical protein
VIIPLLKPGKPAEEMGSYQPITLTSILAKVFERMTSTKLKWFLESQNLLAEEHASLKKKNMSISNSKSKYQMCPGCETRI